MTPCGDRDLGQHWLRLWLVAWQHQAITWTNVDLLLVRFNDILFRAISEQVSQVIYHCHWLEKYSSTISLKPPRPQSYNMHMYLIGSSLVLTIVVLYLSLYTQIIVVNCHESKLKYHLGMISMIYFTAQLSQSYICIKVWSYAMLLVGLAHKWSMLWLSIHLPLGDLKKK